MSHGNKVVWADGYLLRSQHFQQERRYVEQLLDQRMRSVQSYAWGFQTLQLDRELLSIGKIGVASAIGIFPDGTPIVIPSQDLAPLAMDVDVDVKGQIVYLAIPNKTPGQQEIFLSSGTPLTRHAIREIDVRDETSDSVDSSASLQVASLAPEIRLESQTLEGFVTLGIGRVIEVKQDKQLQLDTDYIPPSLDCRAQPNLYGFITQVQALLNHRGQELASRVNSRGQLGTAQTSDLLKLQIINRMSPLFEHYSSLERLHPLRLFEALLQLAGELATFSELGRPSDFPTYNHDQLETIFEPVVSGIRIILDKEIVPVAQPIPIQEVRPQLYGAHISDKSLLDNASFILVVSADIPGDRLQKEFPGLAKLASREDIVTVYNDQTRGIPLRILPNGAPPEMKANHNAVYFGLDSSSDLWRGLHNTGSLALHLGKVLPNLELELWVIRH